MSERLPSLSLAEDNIQHQLTTRSWFIPLLMRLHFYIGLFVGPFMLIAALSGIFYALTPQIESYYYADRLYHSSQGPALPLALQIRAAQADAPAGAALAAVRPSAAAGENTRVLFNVAGMQASERLAVFVDPVSAETHGQLPVYGTSGVLPLRTWLDQLHRSLLLGELGRNYSELAASWLWLAALGGLALWGVRRRAARRQRGIRGVHQQLGVIILLGLVFFSATGLTWSQWAGDNISVLRQQFGWATPSISTALHAASATSADEHAEHRAHGMSMLPQTRPEWRAESYDRVLHAARQAGIDAQKIEIRQPSAPDQAWSVSEIDRRWPTQVDAVAVDGATMQITDKVSFERYPLAAKLTRWGIDLHMGVLFGWVNELVLVAFAAGLVAMVVMGYVMWWRGRPTRITAKPPRSPLLVLRRTPKGWLSVIVVCTLLLAFALPVMGISLLLFLLCDLLRYLWQKQH
ncbi:TPA: PepSY-associated TM helix domain-containing protein [Serratia odorifera]